MGVDTRCKKSPQIPHEIEQFCIHTGISSINTVKIVPLNKFEDIVAKIKSNSH